MRYAKLSPDLAAAAADFRTSGGSALAAHSQALAVVTPAAAVKKARVVVFLHTAGDGVDLDHLADLGVEVNGGGDAIRTGIVPLESLDALSEDPALTRIVPSRPLRLLMDVAGGAVSLPAFRNRSRLTGKGVVVGIVDSGIEVGHDSFVGRISRLWDQTLNGQGVPEGRYGAELKGPTLSLSRDTNGHGTHVAGIAAGAHDLYGGVAPEARLVVVKTDLQTAHVADGIRYIFRTAADMKRPAVVNLSLGGHDDAHDGTDSLSQVIDQSVGPGRIVCCAAGNEGNDNIHAQVQVRRGGTRTIACAVARPAANEPPTVASFTGWYSGADRVAVAAVSPSDEQTPFQPVLATGSPVRRYAFADGAVSIITPGPDTSNGDHNFVVQIEPAAGSASAPAPRGGWRLRLKGTRVTDGTVHLWSVDGRLAQLTGRTVADSTKVGSPGSATGAITVGSYTSKTTWEDVFGHPHQAGFDLNDISDFSSEGPRRDGGQKPDLAAPGAMVVSALSVHSGVLPEHLIDSHHTIMAGTSMSAPFVSGLVALLLQRDRTLGPEAVRELLRSHSKLPGQPGGQDRWDPKWGCGLIDARNL
ncbi:MAG: Peptidase S8 and S53, subtilisin, kexin, sedolisin [uncultured Acidimicrobiales bacterium]|uniref:Peptidase S8 and S53, subtilisin, kexin, sedolisin n=1 Tax=uncultured Acidimicrobiales bacterium TaxID=310071 RepID=A0A6J4ICC0_9ACTN|nr:MAG: Peptidase S8 and S53, subtilisin, kexin, sedolisin [uncultured Acidimicrobiales bacterium]